MVAVDADFLTLLLKPDAKPPRHPGTKNPVEHAREKVEYLVQTLGKKGEKILVPTPALSEVLVLAREFASEALLQLTNVYGFEVGSFDQRAAVEAAITTSNAIGSGKKRGKSLATWAKVKFDRQIVAIAKIRGATAIYSNDDDVHKMGALQGIPVIAVWDLPDPPPKQTNIEWKEESPGK
jgi:hypothetical protein